MCNKENIRVTKEAYPDCSPRMLLASFLICKFPDVVFANSPLAEAAKTIVEQIKSKQPIQSDNAYFVEFLEWKYDDSEKLQIEISTGITLLEDMRIQDEADEADAQWNHGISENIRRMKECKTKLASFSPPSS